MKRTHTHTHTKVNTINSNYLYIHDWSIQTCRHTHACACTHTRTHNHTRTHAHTHTHTHNDIHENWVLIPAGEEVLWGEEGFQFGFKRWQSWALSKLFREGVPNAGYKVRERAKATSLAFVLLDFSACRCQKKSAVHETIHSEDIAKKHGTVLYKLTTHTSQLIPPLWYHFSSLCLFRT